MKEEWYTAIKKHTSGIDEITSILANFIVISGWLYSKISQELPRVLFCIFIMMSWVSIFVIIKKYLSSRKKLHRSEKRRLSRLAKDNEKCKTAQGKCYAREKEKVREKYRKKKNQIICRKLVMLILNVFLTFVLITSNPQNAQACYDGIVRILMEEETIQKADIADGLQVERIEEEIDITENNNVEESDITGSLKPSGYQFVLKKPCVRQQIDPEIENEVFFLDEKNKTRMRSYEEGWMSGNGYKGVDYRTVRDENGNNYYTFADQEAIFIQKISDFQDVEDYAYWIEHAPTSAELQGYMEGLEHLNEIVEEGEIQGCWKIWWHLANDNQRLAQEYEIQTENEQAIVYYYVMSIHCCMEALSYEMSKEDYEMIYHYMVMRYHDLYNEDTKVPQIYKNRAEELYWYFVSYDHKYRIPKVTSEKEVQ